jgi:hypothetical protein
VNRRVNGTFCNPSGLKAAIMLSFETSAAMDIIIRHSVLVVAVPLRGRMTNLSSAVIPPKKGLNSCPN